MKTKPDKLETYCLNDGSLMSAHTHRKLQTQTFRFVSLACLQQLRYHDLNSITWRGGPMTSYDQYLVSGSNGQLCYCRYLCYKQWLNTCLISLYFGGWQEHKIYIRKLRRCYQFKINFRTRRNRSGKITEYVSLRYVCWIHRLQWHYITLCLLRS